MRLELASFPVRDVRFAASTAYDDGVLSIDHEQLRALLLASGDFEDVAIEIVRPGDAARLIHVMDAVEPRWKAGGGTAFPGFLNLSSTSAGEGRTHRLSGMAVLALGDAVAGETTYWREAIVDMSGPLAQVTPFGSTINLALEFRPSAEYLDPNHPDAAIANMMTGSPLSQRYNQAVRMAELRAAEYLAQSTAQLEPDDLAIYELAPADPELPKVVYFFQMSGLLVYGRDVERALPTVMHPNELLDGALVNIRSNSFAASRYSTYECQTHALIQTLYAHHGVDLNFAGAIVYPATAEVVAVKEVVSSYAVKLARMLGAQGACSSYMGGGHPCVEFMLICQKAERAGIKMVGVMPEGYGTPDDPGFVHFVPEATRIVSTGRTTQQADFPAVERVLGGQSFFNMAGVPGDQLQLPYYYVFGACVSTGSGQLAARQY
ncbi:MAG: glycine/sarcosine/betaine reductase component B subunit [Chloroflexota bacterium]